MLIALDLEYGLCEAGFDVMGTFDTCNAALAALAQASPDVAVLDVILKEGPCLELATELRRRGIPFVVCSGGEEAQRRLPSSRERLGSQSRR